MLIFAPGTFLMEFLFVGALVTVCALGTTNRAAFCVFEPFSGLIRTAFLFLVTVNTMGRHDKSFHQMYLNANDTKYEKLMQEQF